MNTQSNGAPESLNSQQSSSQRSSFQPPSAPLPATRPLYWSLRRELWENRYLYIAPLAVAAIFLFGYLINIIHSPSQVRALARALLLEGHMNKQEDISGSFDISAALLMATGILMSLFYCAEALHGERRDRSILFWKSLPVSDFNTVLVKASIPLLILPVVISAITAVLHLLMLLLSSAVLVGIGGNVSTLWAHVSILQISLLMFYHVLTAHALWPAPVYCWLVLVSGWARRATLLWAALPIVAIGGLEKIAFGTTYFAALVGERFIGSTAPIASTDVFPTSPMTHITPGAFLTTPGLWIGLAVAAVFLFAAVRLRRYQGPI